MPLMEPSGSKERRSVSRQFHSKSRNGCLTCRRRRVRCNLQAPICANCHRRNESCSYQHQESRDPNEAILSNALVSPYIWIPENGNVHKGLLHSRGSYHDASAWVLAGENVTCGVWDGVGSLSKGPINWVMEETFLLSWLSTLERGALSWEFNRQADTFEYVGRTITALYALHEWSRSTSRSNLYADAYRYHIEASILFRNSQLDVNESNWMGILMFGIGVIVFQFATALRTSDGTNDHIELLRVLRSSSSLASQLGPYLLMSPLTKLGHGLPKSHLDDFTWNALCYLDFLDYPEGTSAETRQACLQSITALKGWVVEIDGQPSNWRHFICWPAAVSEQYLAALSDKHPVAVVIFVYWCCIMNRSPKRWYMVGWANRAASTAMRHLGEEWNIALEFPRTTLTSDISERSLFAL
ncbi:hypothetical protein GGS26DRAFT_454536 [Hypomontagnella submonticulosa]|nr:hypothetical protein GGS26DRAFT_454536 [Hypomontagnella submonticulosa]